MNESVATQSDENDETKLNEAINNILTLIAQIEIKNFDSFDKISEDEIEKFSKNIKIVEKCEKDGYKKLQEALNLNEGYTPSFKNVELTKKLNILNNNLKFRDLYGKYMLKCEFDINFFSLLYLHEKDSLIYNLFRESGLDDIIKNGSRDEENDGYVYTDELKISQASLIADACRILLGDILYVFQRWMDDNAYNQLIDAEYANVDIFDKVEISGQEETFISEYKAVSLLLMGFNNLQNNGIDYYFLWKLFYRAGYNNNYMLQIFSKIDSVFEKCNLENEIYHYDSSLFFIKDVYEPFFVFKKNWEKVCYKMKVSNLSRLLNLFLEKFNCEENVKQDILNLIEKLNSDQFIKQNDFDLASMRSYRNYVNYVIEASNFEYAEEMKTFFKTNIFCSGVFKKAIEDEKFLNILLNKELFEILLKLHKENQRLFDFDSNIVTWETKLKIFEGKSSETNSSFLMRVNRKPQLSSDEIYVLGELISRCWKILWWIKNIFLNLSNEDIAFITSIYNDLSSESERVRFLNWIYANKYRLIIIGRDANKLVPYISEEIQNAGFFILSRNQQKVFDFAPEENKKEFRRNFAQYPEFRKKIEFLGETIFDKESRNDNIFTPDILEKIQDIGFFILSKNQQKVFELVPELNREEFKNNFLQHPEFRATVELLGQTITDTESFVKLYGGFIWAFNLVNSSIQLGLAMQFVIGKVMAQFLMGISENDREEINKKIDEIETFSSRPRIEYQPSEIQI